MPFPVFRWLSEILDKSQVHGGSSAGRARGQRDYEWEEEEEKEEEEEEEEKEDAHGTNGKI